jgi:hypothetical protein
MRQIGDMMDILREGLTTWSFSMPMVYLATTEPHCGRCLLSGAERKR